MTMATSECNLIESIKMSVLHVAEPRVVVQLRKRDFS